MINLPVRKPMRNPPFPQKNKGQVLVIFAGALLVLLIFIGLAIDGSQLYLNYTRLKRAVDAAAVAAANDFRRGTTLDQMQSAALEILDMQQVDTSTVAIKVYVCDNNADGVRDASLQTEAPEFYNLCPASGLQRKLVYVRAFENSPTYFVSLVGIQTIPISTTAVAEAAPVDLVIVLDTSESMGRDTPGFNSADFDPNDPNGITDCNSTNTCEPLKTTKEAAKGLINSLYPGYDRAAVVTFDSQAHTPVPLGDLATAAGAVDSGVKLHDDPPSNKLFASWDNNGTGGRVNPVNPEDRDNHYNGSADPDPDLSASTQCTITVPGGDRWDTTKNIPCDLDASDNPNSLDAFDWDQDGLFSDQSCAVNPNSDYCKSKTWVDANGPMSLVSTCSGCGIREATDELVRGGRSNAVWVIVFLSDGLANMSDTPATFSYDAGTEQGIPAIYPNGFCGGKIDVSGTTVDPPHMTNFWKTSCVDWNVPPSPPDNCSVSDWNSEATPKLDCRYCINNDPTTCPPDSYALTKTGSTYSPPYSPPYSVEDYARDMTDRAALTVSANPNELRGNDIAIYSIGFPPNTNPTILANFDALGEPLLRYMAAVGDDGDRTTDPCQGHGPRETCGQYYYAPNSSALTGIFQDIASRIYTKISE